MKWSVLLFIVEGGYRVTFLQIGPRVMFGASMSLTLCIKILRFYIHFAWYKYHVQKERPVKKSLVFKTTP